MGNPMVVKGLIISGYLFPFFFAEKRVPLTIEPDDYIAMLNACDSIKFYVKGKVTETNQSFSKQRDVEVEKPELQVTVS